MSRKLASTIIALCASFLSVNALADTFAGKVLDGEVLRLSVRWFAFRT